MEVPTGAGPGSGCGSLAPPQVGVMFRWPGTVTVNGAKVGDVRVVSSNADAGAVP